MTKVKGLKRPHDWNAEDKLKVVMEAASLEAEQLGEFLRNGPLAAPANKLNEQQRQQVLDISNSVAFRDLSPNQIVPKLADQKVYLASESTFYRVLKEHKMLTHLQASKPAVARRPKEHVATGPCQVWCWDITYL